jgi:hypothetical protein
MLEAARTFIERLHKDTDASGGEGLSSSELGCSPQIKSGFSGSQMEAGE